MIDPILLGYYKEEPIKHSSSKKKQKAPGQAAREAGWKFQGIAITWAQYQKLLDEQAGRCAACRALPQKRALAVDHDHDTGLIRGLLCTPCNYFLGRNREKRVLQLAKYLARHMVKHHGRELRAENASY